MAKLRLKFNEQLYLIVPIFHHQLVLQIENPYRQSCFADYSTRLN